MAKPMNYSRFSKLPAREKVSVGPFNDTPGGGGVGGGDWAAPTPVHGSRLGIRVTTARKKPTNSTTWQYSFFSFDCRWLVACTLQQFVIACARYRSPVCQRVSDNLCQCPTATDKRLNSTAITIISHFLSVSLSDLSRIQSGFWWRQQDASIVTD